MRVSVHQSENRDVQCVPKLSHHQPAVDIWHAFTLINTNTPVIQTVKQQSYCLFLMRR